MSAAGVERGAGFSTGTVLALAIIAVGAAPAALLIVDARTATSVAPVAAPSVAALDKTSVERALDAIAVQGAAATTQLDDAERRAVVAERGDRLRVLQKIIAKAREARRNDGQTGAALRGPFPLSELGDLTSLGISSTRWLITRDGKIAAPSGIVVDADLSTALSTAGKDEEAAAIDGTVNGGAVSLARRCVPFEPYCIIDVDDKAAPARAAIVDTADARAALAALAPPHIVDSPATAATSTPTTSPGLVALAALAFIASLVIARRVHRLGAAVRTTTLRLRAPAGTAPAASAHGFAELNALEAAIDDVHTALVAANNDTAPAHRRARLTAMADALTMMRTREAERVGADDNDDAATARLALAVDNAIEAQGARAQRSKLVVDEVAGVTNLLAPLAQRLLRLSRLPDLPPPVSDELASLGSALGQKAKAQNALAALQAELAPLLPTHRDVMVDAAAVSPLPEADAVRLATHE